MAERMAVERAMIWAVLDSDAATMTLSCSCGACLSILWCAARGAPYVYSATDRVVSFELSEEVNTAVCFRAEAPPSGDVSNAIRVLQRTSGTKMCRKSGTVEVPIQRHL